MSILVNQFVAAHVSKSTATGAVTPPAAGTVPTADGAGGADWLPAGGGVTLASAGGVGSESLVVDGASPTLSVKGLIAAPGTGLSLATVGNDVEFTNTSPASSVALTSAGGTETLVNNGAGPALAVKGLTAGTGIALTGSATDVTVANTSPASSVALTSAGGTETLVNDGAGPALAVKGLTAGTGIALTGSATDVAVAIAQPVSFTAFRQWGLVSVANSVAETDMIFDPSAQAAGSLVIPANSLVPGAVYMARMAGTITSTVGPVVTFRLRLSGTQVASAAFDVSQIGAGAYPYELTLTFMGQIAGIAGSVVGSGNLQLQCTVGTIPPVSGVFAGQTTVSGPIVINTTIAQTISLTSQQSLSAVAQSVTARFCYIERK